jgi:anhydro-N-acetylmuramic acid kinase
MNPSYKFNAKKVVHCVGIMSGTSLDAVDFVYCSIFPMEKSTTQTKMKWNDIATVPFPKSLLGQLKVAVSHDMSVDKLSILHHDFGRFIAKSLEKIIEIQKWKVQLVGFHGQTVCHLPPKTTLQIGEPSYISNITGCPVVSDFRVGDLAAGGQGAPLASLFHQQVLGPLLKQRAQGKAFAVQNIGGISNLTLFDKKAQVTAAFDTGPGNMLMDLAMSKLSHGKQTYDRFGLTARKGRVDAQLLKHLMSHPFMKQRSPKSCGREEFGETLWEREKDFFKKLSLEDMLATLTDFTAKSSGFELKNANVGLVAIAGGGAKNPFLMERIRHYADCEVCTVDDYWPTQAIEGAAFALLAYYRMLGLVSNLPKTTGATRGVCLGKISL